MKLPFVSRALYEAALAENDRVREDLRAAMALLAEKQASEPAASSQQSAKSAEPVRYRPSIDDVESWAAGELTKRAAQRGKLVAES